MGTEYSAFDVLKSWCTTNNFTVTNFSLTTDCYPDGVQFWVEPKDNIVNLVCRKLGDTQFFIWGYNSSYTEIFRTSFNYADVNTPPLSHQSAYNTAVIGE